MAFAFQSLKVIGTDKHRSATCDFLLTFHSNHGPILYRFSDKLQYQSIRNSAIADKPRDAFRGKSRSPNMVPFHMLGIVSCYCGTVTLSVRYLRYWDIRLQKCGDLENWVRAPWKVIGNEAENQHCRPAGATRCSNSHEFWYGRQSHWFAWSREISS